MCGSAIFVGVFQGRVGINPKAIGTIAVQVKHDPLPLPGHHAAITGGSWQLLSGLRLITGDVTGDLLAVERQAVPGDGQAVARAWRHW